MHRDPNRYKGNCENCGVPDLLYFYEHVLEGIALCDDCSGLPVAKIIKTTKAEKWKRINGEGYPQNYPIAKA